MLLDVLRKGKDQPMKPGFVLLIVHLANADLLTEIKQAQEEGRLLMSGWACLGVERGKHVSSSALCQAFHCIAQFVGCWLLSPSHAAGAAASV